jgi:hypothetical protein
MRSRLTICTTELLMCLHRKREMYTCRVLFVRVKLVCKQNRTLVELRVVKSSDDNAMTAMIQFSSILVHFLSN